MCSMNGVAVDMSAATKGRRSPQPGDEVDVAGQPVELGDQQGRPMTSADRQGAGQLGPTALLATFSLHHLRQDAPTGAGDVPCYGLALRLDTEAGRALPQRAD